MQWADFGLRVAQTLVWPAVLVVALVLFRTRIGELLGRIEEWSGFGQKVKIRERQREAKAELADRVRSTATPLDVKPEPQVIKPEGIPSGERVGVPAVKIDAPELAGIIESALQIGSTTAQLGEPLPRVDVDVAGQSTTVTFDHTLPDGSGWKRSSPIKDVGGE